MVACLSIAMQNILFLGMAAWAWGLTRQKRLPAWPKPLGLWLLFILWALAASLLSENPAHSLDTWKKWLLGLTAVYTADALATKRDLRAVLGSLLFFSGLTFLGAVAWSLREPLSSGLGWAELLALWPQKGEWRAVSGSGGYMVLGTCSMLVLVFYSGLALKDAGWRKPMAWICLAAAALALLFTQTRSAWIGAAAGLLALAWSWRRGLALGVAGLALASLLIPGNPVAARIKDGLDMSQDSTRSRVYMAQAGLSIIKSHPWLGVGDALESFDGKPGHYLRHLPAAAKQWLSLKDKDEGHLHNNFLQVGAMTGLPGLALLLAFFMALAGRAARSPSPLGPALAAALLAWFMNGLFEYNFGSLQSSFLLWFLVGLYFAGEKLDARSAD